MVIQHRLTGRVVEALVGTDDASLITSPRESVRVTFDGIQGDRHAGFTRLANARDPYYARGTEIRNERQVTIVSAEELAEVAARMELPKLEAAWIGANLLVVGIPNLTRLPPHTRMIFPQHAVLVVQGENLPCRWSGEAIAQRSGVPESEARFPKAAIHLRGVIACVERPGYISPEDEVQVEVPSQTIYSPSVEVSMPEVG